MARLSARKIFLAVRYGLRGARVQELLSNVMPARSGRVTTGTFHWGLDMGLLLRCCRPASGVAGSPRKSKINADAFSSFGSASVQSASPALVVSTYQIPGLSSAILFGRDSGGAAMPDFR